MRNKPSTTIRDVAKLANVSVGTVSRVLNDNPAVSEKTRDRVKDAIAELDYMPNPLARQLSIGRTLTLGIIQPYITLPSYTERLRGVQHVLADSEYDLVIFNVDKPEQRNAYFKDLSYKMRVDGFIIVSLPPNDEQAEYFSKSRIPVVFVDAYHPRISCVIADDVRGSRIAVSHLYDLGHRKIAFLSDYIETPFHPAMRYRLTGYRNFLSEVKIPINEDYIIQGKRGRISAREMARKLLSLENPPTAIFATSDTQAIGILDVAKEIGIRVPKELSVIGYDNIPDSAYSHLTTIDQSLYESGATAARSLLEVLAGSVSPPFKKHVPLNLIIRNTTAAPYN